MKCQIFGAISAAFNGNKPSMHRLLIHVVIYGTLISKRSRNREWSLAVLHAALCNAQCAPCIAVTIFKQLLWNCHWSQCHWQHVSSLFVWYFPVAHMIHNMYYILYIIYDIYVCVHLKKSIYSILQWWRSRRRWKLIVLTEFHEIHRRRNHTDLFQSANKWNTFTFKKIIQSFLRSVGSASGVLCFSHS